MEQLRFTTSKAYSILSFIGNEVEPLVTPSDVKDIVGNSKYNTAYIHGDAEVLAGFDIPIIIDGNLEQLDLPIEQQNILMMLPFGNYQCISKLNMETSNPQYWITLKK